MTIVERSERDLLLESYELGQRDFPKSPLHEADLHDKYLVDVDLSESDLTKACLRNTKLRSANLTGAHLSNADMRGVVLRHANLSNANLCRANITDGKLHSANLTGADLRYVDFTGADLSCAILRGANLWGVSFTGALLCGADFGDQWVIQGPTRSDGYVFFAQLFTLDKEPMVRAGCRYFTIPEAWEHWQRTRSGTRLGEETFAILKCLEQLIEIKQQQQWKD